MLDLQIEVHEAELKASIVGQDLPVHFAILVVNLLIHDEVAVPIAPVPHHELLLDHCAFRVTVLLPVDLVQARFAKNLRVSRQRSDRFRLLLSTDMAHVSETQL